MTITLVLAGLLIGGAARGQGRTPHDFAYLRDVDPSIAQDMRYATANNFTGKPLPGYDAPECVLRREVADALKAVQADLARLHLSLKVYDCYRPQRATRAMSEWAHDGGPAGPGKRFFPKLQKDRLFELGYIASRSLHNTGTAVDLTLTDLNAPTAAPFDPNAAYGPCTGPVAERAPDNSIDMGTSYDCFDVAAHTASPVTAEQRKYRDLLVATMARHGFANYDHEWWHFTYTALSSAPPQDFPILPRR